jgi:hypothetical protein
MKRDIASAAIKEYIKKWYLDKFLKVGIENVFIIATTFNLKQLANVKRSLIM